MSPYEKFLTALSYINSRGALHTPARLGKSVMGNQRYAVHPLHIYILFRVAGACNHSVRWRGAEYAQPMRMDSLGVWYDPRCWLIWMALFSWGKDTNVLMWDIKRVWSMLITVLPTWGNNKSWPVWSQPIAERLVSSLQTKILLWTLQQPSHKLATQCLTRSYVAPPYMTWL